MTGRCAVCGEPGAFTGAANDGTKLYHCDRHAARPEAPRPGQGQILRNVVGVDVDGRVPDKTEPWQWRPPTAFATAHHQQEILLGGAVHYQQAPPVHVAGARYVARSPRRRIASRRTAADLAGRLDVLTPEQRAPLELQLAGASYSEIAEALGLKVDAVRERLRRARARLGVA